MLEAIVFDLDGTLTDSKDAILASFNHALTSHGFPKIDPVEYTPLIGIPLENQLLFFIPQNKLSFVPSICRAYHEHMMKKGMKLIQVYPNVKETLERLPQKLGIATSKTSENAIPILEYLGLKKYFPVIVCNDDVKNPKPAPDLLLKALEKIRVKPENALYVGDTRVDMEMAKNTGTKACAVTYGYGKREELAIADFIIDDFKSLEAIAFNNRTD